MEWYQAVIVFAVAFAVAYCMVPVSKKIAFRIGAIDYPGYRRMNREPIPRCGGIALYVGLIAACFTMFLGVRFFDWDLHDLYILSDVNYIVLFIGRHHAVVARREAGGADRGRDGRHAFGHHHRRGAHAGRGRLSVARLD